MLAMRPPPLSLLHAVDLGSLVRGRQKRAAVALRAAGRIDRDESRQLGVLGSQPVQRPGAHRRALKAERAGVHLDYGLRMHADVGVHAIEQAQIVGMLGQVRKDIRQPQPALAMLG